MGRNLLLTSMLSSCGLAATAAAADPLPAAPGSTATPPMSISSAPLAPPLLYQAPPEVDEATAPPPSHPWIRQLMASLPP